MKRLLLFPLLFVAFFSTSVVFAEEEPIQEVSFELNAPNVNKVIAPGRDFYVLGSINGELPNDARVEVSLYDENSNMVRQVYSEKKSNKDGIHYNYPLIELKGTTDLELVKDSMMPDLMYDGINLETFKDQWRKCYYDDYNFTATFNGGRYNYDVNPNDENGNRYSPLVEGEYKIVIEAKSNTGESLGKTESSITVANIPNKIMSRFSPNKHYQNILNVAEETGYTLYIDDFSGLFYSVPFLTNYPQEMQVWINRKWQFMDAVEYETGLTHFYIYNVSEDSTTWKVELATIQNLNKINDSTSLKNYYYDIGDTSVSGITGKFKEFEENDNLELNRVDFPEGTSQDNYVDITSLDQVNTDTDLTDGILANSGETISLYGVVKPIQAAKEDIVYDEDKSEYKINNKIDTLKYSITGENVNQTFTKKIGLNRKFDSTTTTNSLLEFKNDILIDEQWAGKLLSIKLEGYDSHGNRIDGTQETISLQVSDAVKEAA